MTNAIGRCWASTAAQMAPSLSTAELLATTGTGLTSMADLLRRHRVRWLGHVARNPNDVMAKQHTPSRATLGPHLTWMGTAMHDMGSLGHTPQMDLPRDWANLAPNRDVWRGVVSRY